MHKNMHKSPKRNMFAIRKLTIGAAAVLLAGPVLGASTQKVQAEEHLASIQQAAESTTEAAPVVEGQTTQSASTNAGQVTGQQTGNEQVARRVHKGKDLTTTVGVMPNPEDVIPFKLLPGQRAEWRVAPNVNAAGEYACEVTLIGVWGSPLQIYSSTVTVKEAHKPDNEKYQLVPKENTTTDLGKSLEAKETVANLGALPNGTNISWVTEPNWDKAGLQTGTIQAKYPDGTKSEVTKVTVTVKEAEKPDKDKYKLVTQDVTTTVGNPWKAADTVKNLVALPKGTEISWVKGSEPNWEKEGTYTGKIQAKYPDGSLSEETEVKVTVKKKATQSDEYDITTKDVVTKVKNPVEAEKAVKDFGKLPKGTTVVWVWNATPDWEKAGTYEAKIQVKFPDGSHSKEIPVKVTVEDILLNEIYEPEATDLKTTIGKDVSAEAAITNIDKLPPTTTFEWDGAAPDVSKEGTVETTIKVTYQDGSVDRVTIKVTVEKDEDQLELVTDTDKHPELLKKVTRKIFIHHPDGDKEPIEQTATFTRAKYVYKGTNEFHSYTAWSPESGTWDEHTPEKVDNHNMIIKSADAESIHESGVKVAAKTIDPNNENHKDVEVHVHYEKINSGSGGGDNTGGNNPGGGTDNPGGNNPGGDNGGGSGSDTPDTPDTPDAPDTPETPDTDEDVNNGSANNTNRPGVRPQPTINYGSGQGTQNSARPLGYGESNSSGANDSRGYVGDTLPQTSWGHILSGLVITIWCVLFGLAIRENVNSRKEREAKENN